MKTSETTIERVSADEYRLAVQSNLCHVFNSVAFCQLNAHKCTELHYLLFRNDKTRLALALGQTDDTLLSPFSAPFGGFELIRKNVSLATMHQAVQLLVDYAKGLEISKIQIVVPPSFYNLRGTSKTINALLANGFAVEDASINHAIHLPSQKSNSLKNSSLHFRRCKTLSDKKIAYDIIARNRKSKNYVLRMSWQQVEETISVVEADFFVVTTATGEALASAMVFRVQPKRIAQVVYWGNLPDTDHLRPMPFLARQVFDYYAQKGFEYVDVGPSGCMHEPNFSLSDFKDGIGCFTDNRFTFLLRM